MPMKLQCGNCGNPHPALEPLWGSHHGRFRVSIYECQGYETTKGCGAMGAEIHDAEEDRTLTYGCIETAESVEVEPLDDE
jgi:hypothetical protein